VASPVLTSLAAAGTPAGACAWRRLQKQGVTVTRICGLVVADTDAERLSTLLTSLPALVSISEFGAFSGLTLQTRSDASAAAVQDFLAGAARTIGRCSRLQHLDLHVKLADELADRMPGTVWQYLAEARALEHLQLTIGSDGIYTSNGSAAANASHVLTGLAGLLQLRTLTLTLDINVCGEVTLPACVSRLVQLTSLTVSGICGLNCAPGWARLPALARLEFVDCDFTCVGEDALPGMDALASLTSLELWDCSGLHVLPTSLWRLTQLRCLVHCLCDEAPRDWIPVLSLPACASACAASLTQLSLTGHNMPTWPACVLAATRLAHLDLTRNCFAQLPEGVSVLTALQTLYLGRLSAGELEIGGALDACALGSLACFPALRELSFANCSVLFGPSFQAAAAHPRLQCLELSTSYPACGPSCQAFLGFALALLQQGRADVLCVRNSIVEGAGQQDGQRFRAALEAVGVALCDDGDGDAEEAVGVAQCDDGDGDAE
jgi:hypothetical protein